MNFSAKPKLFIRGPGGLDSQNKKVSKNLVTLLSFSAFAADTVDVGSDAIGDADVGF